MSANPFGVLNVESRVSDSVAWAGGNGVFSVKGTRGDQSTVAIAVILEDDSTGEFSPTGDATLRTIGEKKQFFLPAGTNIRTRLSGGDAGTSIEPFYA